MNTHVSVQVHAEAKDTFERHLPFWLQIVNGDRSKMLAWMPEDSKLHIEGMSYYAVGKKEHHGRQSIIRFQYMLEHLAGLDFDRYVIYEYDALTVGPLPADTGNFAANIFMDENAAKDGFKGTMFCHPPLIMSRAGLSALAREMLNPECQERFFWDRSIGYAVQRCGITTFNLMKNGLGFSNNTILPSQFPELRLAVLNGATCFHGVKTKECLDVITRAAEFRRMRAELDKEGLL